MTTEVNQSRIPEKYQYIGHRESQSGTKEIQLQVIWTERIKWSEIPKIRQNFLNADYPLRFTNSIIKQFNDKLSEKSNDADDYILPPDFFEIKKQVD